MGQVFDNEKEVIILKTKSVRIACLMLITAVLTGCMNGGAGHPGNTESVVSQEDISENIQDNLQSQAVFTDEENNLWNVVNDMVYVPKFSQLEYDGTTYNYFFYEGDNFYFLCNDEDNNGNLNVKVINSVTKKSSDIKFGEKMDEYAKTVDGYVGFTSYISPKLTIYDAGFGAEKQVDLSTLQNKLKADGINYSCDGCQIDTDGNIGMIVSGDLYMMDNNGQVLFSIPQTQEVSQFYKLAVNGDGSMYVWGRNSNYEPVAYRVDMQKQSLGDKLSNLPKVEYDTVIYPVGNYSWYIVTKNEIYLYNTSDYVGMELINLIDYGVALSKYMSGFGTDADGRAVVISKETYMVKDADVLQVSDKDSADIITLDLVQKDTVKERQKLVLASVGNVPTSCQNMIRNFNKYNKDFYISVKNYVDEVSGEYDDLYTAAREKLSLDIVTDNEVDLYYISSYDVDFDSLAQKDVFVNLYEYLDTDEELGRENLFPNVLSELEYNGELIRMCDSFAIDTLVGKSQYLDGIDRLDGNTLDNFTAAHPEMQLMPSGNQMAALNMLTMYRLDEFSDGEDGFCSEKFIKLLELAKNIPYQTDLDYAAQMELLRDGRALVSSEQVMDVKDMQWFEKLFGDKVTYLGYSTKNASDNLIEIPSCFAINSGSKNKEAAWEFIKGFLMLDLQKDCVNIPVNIEAFEQKLSESDNTIKTYGMGDITAEIEWTTDEQKKAYRELVYSASGTAEYDMTLYSIVCEEAENFFSGVRDAKETADIIQNRVQLYLEERK